MEKEVLISIKGLQRVEDQEDTVETVSAGQYYRKNGKHFLLYDEMSEGPGTVKNMLRIDETELSLKRSGSAAGQSMSTELLFRLHDRVSSEVQTPMGVLNLEFETSSLRIRETEEQIVALLEYKTYANGEQIAEHYLRIQVDPKRNGIRLR